MNDTRPEVLHVLIRKSTLVLLYHIIDTRHPIPDFLYTVLGILYQTVSWGAVDKQYSSYATHSTWSLW